MTTGRRMARLHRSEGTILGLVPQQSARHSAYSLGIMRPSIGKPDGVE
jgi:hypothetical protein